MTRDVLRVAAFLMLGSLFIYGIARESKQNDVKQESYLDQKCRVMREHPANCRIDDIVWYEQMCGGKLER